jgi:hypothetical protein
MMRYPRPRPRARIVKSRTPYLCFSFSTLPSLVDVRACALELVERPVLFVNDSELVVVIFIELLPLWDFVAAVDAVVGAVVGDVAGVAVDTFDVVEVLEEVVAVVVEDWADTLLEEGGLALLGLLELIGVEEPIMPELTALTLHE